MCSVECEDGGVLATALGRGQVESIKDSLLIMPSWAQPGTVSPVLPLGGWHNAALLPTCQDCGVWEEGTRQRDDQVRAFLVALTDPAKVPGRSGYVVTCYGTIPLLLPCCRPRPWTPSCPSCGPTHHPLGGQGTQRWCIGCWERSGFGPGRPSWRC